MSVVDLSQYNPAAAPRVEKARVGIVVDASCDVPDTFLKDPDVAIIPIPIKIGNHTYVDQHDPEATRRYLRENANGEGASGLSVPLDAEAMKALFVERFSLDYDSIYCLTITQTRSPIYDAASQGSLQALNAIRTQREASGIARPFQFRVIDTKQMFAGAGISALALWDLLKRGVDARDVRDPLYRVIDSTYAYTIPDDLAYARNRSKARGDRSISMLNALLGSTLDIKPIIQVAQGNTAPMAKCRGRQEAWGKLFKFVSQLAARGLNVPHVITSYAGPISDVLENTDYAQLRHVCDSEGIALHTVQMSITGMMNIGPGGLIIGFSCPEHTPKF